MSINLNLNQYNFSMRNTSSINSSPINRSISTKDMNSQMGKNIMGDKITISSQGLNMSKKFLGQNKVNNVIENLMKQKENLTERKSDMVTNMLEKDMDISYINEMTKGIEEQLKDIDKQIAKLQFEEQQKNIGIDKENEEEKKDKKIHNYSNNTDNDISDQNMSYLISASSDLQDLKVMSSLKDKAKGSISVLEKEIELDESRSLDGKATKYKYEEYDKLKDGLSKLENKIENKLYELNEKQLNGSEENHSINRNEKNYGKDKRYITIENDEEHDGEINF
ncbi:hypothetical protein Curi_c00590 [Gottschalkia acidurici 9a]|uniref:Uncharacterized protein n=1 Tax=Gottschalkia acidurici (strain ATCC 7906 / DSM 604 / BCRC 14475 / CIP 104303 / KCTC 5404 / NCIMB 10678 / 9a) TaxID=1128398 RepID=K0AWN2_GOTA9|nr:hypothetical protein [Gottschalkia acidurici]AFS77140.1 hypothetical protein Curi_c00590 [Gottschalkia acidurici 9a]